MKKIGLILILGFLSGFISDRIYMTYSYNKNKESLEKTISDKESSNYNHMLDSSYGTLVISSMNKDKNTAESDVDFKVGLARIYKWSIIGQKKIETIDGYYRISQTAFRLIE